LNVIESQLRAGTLERERARPSSLLKEDDPGDDLIVPDSNRKGRVTAPAASPGDAPKPVAPAAAESPWVQVRLAERFKFKEPLTIPINGSAGLLCDLSILGCQLVAGTALKPNQKVKIVLPTPDGLTCNGKVMWARLEPSPKGRGFGYRAGIQFATPAQDEIASFIDHRRTLEQPSF
jgi:hypothetical protein